MSQFPPIPPPPHLYFSPSASLPSPLPLSLPTSTFNDLHLFLHHLAPFLSTEASREKACEKACHAYRSSLINTHARVHTDTHISGLLLMYQCNFIGTCELLL